jgi:hypothetical protein
MSLAELKAAAQALEPQELQEFARWVAELEARKWDQQIAADLEAGDFDELIREVQADVQAGNIKPL